MKKLGLAVAALTIIGYAGAAQAQTQQTINATANIDAVLTLTGTDTSFDCGTVTASNNGGACPTSDPGAVEIDANQNWILSIEDMGGTECTTISATLQGTSNNVTLCNDDTGHTGQFVVALEYASTGGAGSCSVYTGTASSATGTAGVDCFVTINGTATAISGLATDDGYGVYNGSFRVTLAAN